MEIKGNLEVKKNLDLAGDAEIGGNSHTSGRVTTTIALQVPDWLTATDYEEGDIVLVSGAMNLCINDHTSGVSFVAEANWTPIAAAMSGKYLEEWKLEVSAAEMLIVNGTPLELAPAPGSMKTRRFVSGSSFLKHNGVDFDLPANIKMYFETLGQTIASIGAPNDSSDTLVTVDKTGASGTPMGFNDRIMISTEGAAEATVGDGVWTLIATFSVEDYNT